MSTFQRKYTHEQEEAVCTHYLDRGVRPARKIKELAASGDLGTEPFEITEAMVRFYASRRRRQRQGKVVSELASMPPRDATEALRRQLLNAADYELRWVQKRQKAGHRDNAARQRDLETLRQIARCVREIVALPGPTEARTAKPGHRDPARDGQITGSVTRGGLAHAMLEDIRAQERKGKEPAAPTAPPPDPETNGQDATGPMARALAHAAWEKERARQAGLADS